MHVDILSRGKVPALRNITHLNIDETKMVRLKNGIAVYIINKGEQEICSVDFTFNAGQWYEKERLTSRFTNRMLQEGTDKFTALELAENLDFYGATLKIYADGDHGTVSFYSLNKHLSKVLPYLEDLIKRPAFPENELNMIARNSKEKFKIRKAKNEYIADRKLGSALFGDTHPYGYAQEEEDYDGLSAQALKDFHKLCYHAGNCFIILSGRIEDDMIHLIAERFGKDDWSGNQVAQPAFDPKPGSERKFHQPVKNSVQSAIRIGKLLFNKTHPDYHKMYFFNTVLGGYFGSRLMSNIREDKGFTYGIHSGISSMSHGGYFYVSTEVGAEVSRQAVLEIYHEIDRLKEELVPDDEMELVRNYLLGRLLSGLDGPFKLSNFHKGLIKYGLTTDYLHNLIETIKIVTPAELRELANKYLDYSDMHEIVIG